MEGIALYVSNHSACMKDIAADPTLYASGLERQGAYPRLHQPGVSVAMFDVRCRSIRRRSSTNVD